MNDLLKSTIEELAIKSIKEIDIESIVKDKMAESVRRTVDNLFGSYSEFQKGVESKIKKDLQINLDALTIPDFGNLAIETVVSEIKKVEIEEQERVTKETEKRLREVFGASKEMITLKELEDTFIMSMWEEHIKDMMDDGCYCGDKDIPRDGEEVLEILDSNGEYGSFEFTLTENEWGTYGTYCTSHLYLKFDLKNTKQIIEIHTSRKKGTGERSDFYNEKELNHYSILGISVNGKSMKKEGFISLKDVREDTEQKLVSRFINDSLIDCSELSNFELVED